MYLWPAINSDCIKNWIQKHQNWNATHSFANSLFGQCTSAWALDRERRGKTSAQTDFDTLLDALFLSLMHLPCLYLFLTSELVPLDFSSLKLHLPHNCCPFGVWFIRCCPSREDLLTVFHKYVQFVSHIVSPFIFLHIRGGDILQWLALVWKEEKM